MNPEFWNSRYKEEGFAYGLIPNQFLVEAVTKYREQHRESSPTRVLSIGEGEGRNALYLAKQGFHVHAMDYSSAGLEKLRLESERDGVAHLVQTEVADLTTYDFKQSLGDGKQGWDIILSVFAHVPPPLQHRIFQQVKASLAPDGWFMITAYHPSNIGRGTGGPQAPELLLTKEIMQSAFPSSEWKMIHLEHLEKQVDEGIYHQGVASVIECIVTPNSHSENEYSYVI